MARILIVGCGCRGRSLARALMERGHAVRGTTRRPEAMPEIEATGAEAVLADPDRLSTLLPRIEGVSGVCWLLGMVRGDNVDDLHGPRLQSLLERLVDTHVRGVVYEAAGSVDPELLEQGAGLVGAAAKAYRMPMETVGADPTDADAWLADVLAAVERLLARP